MSIHAIVRHQQTKTQPDSPLNGDVQAISSLLSPVLCTDGGSPTCVTRVRNVLHAAYAGKVTEKSVEGPYYWIQWYAQEQRWCMKCLMSAALEVTVASGVVEVLVEEATHY